MKSISFLNEPYINVIVVITFTIISYILTLFMNLGGGKVNAMINLAYPSVVATATLLLYFISRLCFKKFNWVISFAGTIYMICISVLLS